MKSTFGIRGLNRSLAFALALLIAWPGGFGFGIQRSAAEGRLPSASNQMYHSTSSAVSVNENSLAESGPDGAGISNISVQGDAAGTSKYLVRYLNAPDGAVVIQSNYVDEGEDVPGFDWSANAAKLAYPDGKAFDYWTLEPGAETPSPFTGGSVTGDLNIYPVLTNLWYVLFDSRGGTGADIALVKDGAALGDAYRNSYRENYIFNGWYDKNGQAWDAGTPVSANMTLYAHWTPNSDHSIDYTVIYWIEKPNLKKDAPEHHVNGKLSFIDYDFGFAFPETLFSFDKETVGGAGSGADMIIDDISDISVNIRDLNNPMRYAEWQYTEPTVIDGNGSAVVNVFCKLREYTVTFDLSGMSGPGDHAITKPRADATMTVKGREYNNTDNKYSITIKYGENVAAKWPHPENGTVFESIEEDYAYDSWYTYTQLPGGDTANAVVNGEPNNSHPNGLQRFKAQLTIIGEGQMPMNPLSDGYTVNLQTQEKGTDNNYYYVRLHTGEDFARADAIDPLPYGTIRDMRYFDAPGSQYDGQYFRIHSEDALNTNGSSIKSLYGHNYTTAIQQSGDTGRDYFHLYTAKTSTLHYGMNGHGVGIHSVSVPFGSPLAMSDVTPESAADWNFAGWYKDSNCTTPFIFENEVMPASDLTVFAKWTRASIRVYFIGDTDGSYSLGYAGLEIGAKLPEEDLYQFDNPNDVVLGGKYKGAFSHWVYKTDVNATAVLVRFNPNIPIQYTTNLYAVYQTKGLTVSYDPGEGVWANKTGGAGKELRQDSMKFVLGNAARVWNDDELESPEEGSRVFAGWAKQGDNDGVVCYPGTPYTVTGNTVFTARYLPRSADAPEAEDVEEADDEEADVTEEEAPADEDTDESGDEDADVTKDEEAPDETVAVPLPGPENAKYPAKPTEGAETILIETDVAGAPLGERRYGNEQSDWIFDESPPLGKLPQTGAVLPEKGSNIHLVILLFVFALLAAGFVRPRNCRAIVKNQLPGRANSWYTFR